MVIWHTPSSLPALLLASCLAVGLAGCTSIDGPTEDVDSWKSSWKNRASAVGDGASSGAKAVGSSVATAYRGVRDGFEEPEARRFGPYPKGFAEAIRRHMIRFEKVSEEASFRFGKPEKGFMNAGILAGGKIQWQGWLVDVSVVTHSFAGQKRSKGYVVRMTDGEVEEVHDARYDDALRRLSAEQEPAAVAK